MRARRTTKPQPDKSRRRVFLIALALFAWMVGIGARLAYLQVNRHDDLANQARRQQLGVVETEPTRGQVLDRQGPELARSINVQSFFSIPGDSHDADHVARRLP